MDNQQNDENLTAEELEVKRDEMREFYDNSVPYLESQSKYEKLLTEIEESRYKRATMQYQYASLMASAQGDMEENMSRTAPVQEQPKAKAPAKKGKKLKTS
jgi:hypothetical protein